MDIILTAFTYLIAILIWIFGVLPYVFDFANYIADLMSSSSSSSSAVSSTSSASSASSTSAPSSSSHRTYITPRIRLYQLALETFINHCPASDVNNPEAWLDFINYTLKTEVNKRAWGANISMCRNETCGRLFINSKKFLHCNECEERRRESASSRERKETRNSSSSSSSIDESIERLVNNPFGYGSEVSELTRAIRDTPPRLRQVTRTKRSHGDLSGERDR